MGVIVLGPGLSHAQQQSARKQQSETKPASMHGHHDNPLNRDSAPGFLFEVDFATNGMFCQEDIGRDLRARS
jgi:hypothetical protein